MGTYFAFRIKLNFYIHEKFCYNLLLLLLINFFTVFIYFEIMSSSTLAYKI
jgi:hypothetical protein